MSNPSNDLNPDFQFTAPSMSKSATDGGAFRTIHGLSRPRIARVRKSLHNRTMRGVSVSRKFDTSLNPLQPVSDDCGRVWMKNCDLESGNRNEVSDFVASGMADTITDRMKNLDVKADRDNAENKAIFGLGDSMILDQLGKLKTGDQSKGSHYTSQTGALPEGIGNHFTTEVVNIQGEDSIAIEVQAPQCQANDGIQIKHQFLYTRKQENLSIPELSTPSPKDNKHMEFGAREPGKDDVTGKMKVKYEEPALAQTWATSNVFPKERGEHAYQFSRDTSVVHLDENRVSNDCQQTQLACAGMLHKDLIYATELLGINEGKNIRFGEGRENASSCCVNEGAVEASSEECLSAFKTESCKSVKVLSEMSGENEEVSSGRNDQAQSNRDCKTQFFSASSSESGESAPFEFSASSSVEYQTVPAIRSQKKKIRTKVGLDSYNYYKNTPLSNAQSTIHFSLNSRGPVVLSSGIQLNEHLSNHNCKRRPSSEMDKRKHVKQGITSPSATTLAAMEACEKWRSRGNQAYSSGDPDKAEDYYTKGVNCISKSEASRDELRALMLCFSNRAAVRMSLERFRDALMDCRAASEIDPNFFRVRVRKANCHLALGEVAEALPLLMKLLLLGTEVCVDRKLIVEASESFQKAQVIDEALAISPYSEKLLQMKTEALFMMRMYQEVIEFCEQTLQTAEKNFPLLGLINESSNPDPSEFINNHSFRLWRYSFIFNSYYYIGKLEEAINFLEKQLYLRSATDRYGPQLVESLIPLLISARVQVKHKSAGNAAYQAGNHAEAVEHYTAALSCNAQSRPFAAVCVGNRAAAYQALGQILDAIADCNMAIALDRNYMKAISRRATLFERIRDYDEAASDLRKVISLMTKQAEEIANQTKETDSPVSSQDDLKQAHIRLAQLEELAIKEPPLDLYLILGVEQSATSANLKKAYRKAALRHHPDKACQLLTRSENIDDGIWKEMCEEVQRESDRLFKIIGEAYSVLSDPTKRFRYEEEVRNALKKPSGIGGSRMRSDHSYGYQRSSSSMRTRKESSWASPGNSHSRHFETSRSSRFY
ncbi:hypothetical protein V2J09_018521 [Rumex salicifolius]